MHLTFLWHSPLLSFLWHSPLLSPTDWSRIYLSMASRLITRRYFDRNSASLLVPPSVQLILKGESTRQASKRISGSMATIFSSTSESTKFRGGTASLIFPILLIVPPSFLDAIFTRQFCPSTSSSRFWRYFRAFFKAIRSFFCLTFGHSCSTSSHLSSVNACSWWCPTRTTSLYWKKIASKGGPIDNILAGHKQHLRGSSTTSPEKTGNIMVLIL